MVYRAFILFLVDTSDNFYIRITCATFINIMQNNVSNQIFNTILIIVFPFASG